MEKVLFVFVAAVIIVCGMMYVNDHVFCSSLGGLIKGGCIIR